jgi:type II secretory ATPase GspE/PulE/Tfp pilus assembly ATPase PilB-like protein/ActR/RegA family two-component response regulator
LLGDLLIKAGVLDRAGVERVREVQKRDGGTFGRIAAALGLADERAVARAVASGLGLDYAEPQATPVPPAVAALLPADFCRKRKIVPLGADGRTLRVAMADPLDQGTLQDAEFRTGKWVKAAVAAESDVAEALGRLYPETDARSVDYDLLESVSPEGAVEEAPGQDYEVVDPGQLARDVRLPPVVRLVNMVLTDAAKAGASDVHIEPQDDGLQVRHRIDGMLIDILRIPNHLKAPVVSRLKIIAGMDIAERRKPQDGRSRLRLGDQRVDLRLSSLPTNFGEKVVVRLLATTRGVDDLERMEMAPDLLARFATLLDLPQGMVLVTGPTGSGKTSTLYASLNRIRTRAKNLITVEDPIEFQVPGVSQVQINTRAGVTFAAGLRSILRQDPDIVMVGEIRDRETAAIAVEAAQTGHLLLSTLHTNDAPSSISRLLDLGVEPFMVAASVTGILAQRLVRRVCGECAVERDPSDEVLRHAAIPPPPSPAWKAGRGCDACRQSGYRGRLAIHELFVVDDAIRDLVGRRAPEHELREAARRAGMRTLLEDGMRKAAAGLTTLDEVVRVAPRYEERAPARPADGRRDAGADTAPQPEAAAGPPAGAAGARARVLVVEDSPTVVTVVRYFLELEGFEVLVAEDGLAGLATARRERPDVIVSDVQMPGLDGIALTEALRGDEATRDAGILLLTSETSLESETRGLQGGADDYLAKPVEPRRLAARVRAVLARRQGRRAGAA